MRRVSKFYLILAIMLMFTSLTSLKPSSVKAEECTKQDFDSLFYDDYYPGTKWDNRGGIKNLTWSANASVIDDESLMRSFTPEELEWIRSAFQS
mgnify:CR=1 FL=1